MNKGVAVITGAASGIGAGLAREACSRGMAVVLVDSDGDALDMTAANLSGSVLARKIDVRDQAELNDLADFVYSRFDHVDLLFNNAGVLYSGRVWEINSEAWSKSFDVNVLGIINGLRTFIPRLIATEKPARIINTASVGGFFSGPWLAPYSSSKAAVVALTESLAHELAEVAPWISVSLLAPGPVKTALLNDPTSNDSTGLVEKMRRLTETSGADPEKYARSIFSAIDRGDFWIVPQPESLDRRLVERTAMIIERRSPLD